MSSSSFAFIGLGANLPSAEGSATKALITAAGILHAEPNISISAFSRVWHTPAFPVTSGPDFSNAVAKLQTELSPEALLSRLHRIEADLGRDRSTGRWSARVIDLDLLAMDHLVLPDPATQNHWRDLAPGLQRSKTPEQLILPHPRLQDRTFVLAPWAEIAPDWRHPILGRTIVQMLDALGTDAMIGLHPVAGQILPAFP
ncbi:2-amino-4-hydroxy-6-hydroxymethyldihydropteridine diphosphokinase [Paracoccus sp. Z330]|uniref:2-amino-4-hydroxy-6-hydroxymethyldihydropteridine pyrophosphokinase n=1 Tax=Paracoccus onchidii TaxID=3017813 RepID=A0ABT4ZAV1_9RHOB|nr:2-amino-4-hydroxy-6-hydroxymethyldihydropteridine diphosphokinase [Paracoccus onchidii]MDB6176488.1 2-amino-4-hydroxy-6-hydroxymethyldihydropteridine diphosphokinase [Paracoccus onchidii]